MATPTMGVGDERGEFIDQLRVRPAGLHTCWKSKNTRPIVKTLSTTTMLNKLEHGMPVHETGFKYVAPKMHKPMPPDRR
jgi:hypothetical protein